MDMWAAIQQVTTGLALVAFLAAAAVVVYRATLAHRLKVLNSVPRQRRAEIVKKELNTFGVDATNLTPAQQYDLAKTELNLRSRKVSLIAVGTVVAMLIFGGITIFAIFTAGGHDNGGTKGSAGETPARPQTSNPDPIALLGGCSLANFPFSVAPRETIHLLALNPKHFKAVSWEGLNRFENNTNQTMQWPPEEQIEKALAEHNAQMVWECEINSLGKANLFNVVVSMWFWFGEAAGGIENAVKHETTISPLNSGQSAHFYVVNDCDISATGVLGDSARVKAVGSPAWQQVPLNRKFQNQIEQLMMFFPSKVHWVSGEACE